jgi:VIT1/CCC1 family predicted Fe2+/Mn2+ transporter
MAHARLELRIDPNELTPWHAGLSSMIAFTIGALVPLTAMLIAPRDIAEPTPAVAVAVTGAVAAHLGCAPNSLPCCEPPATGMAAVAITYAIGSLISTQI